MSRWFVAGRRLPGNTLPGAKLAIAAVTAVVVMFVLEPRLAASATAATAGHTFIKTELLPLVIAPGIAVALLVLNVALGVYKPGWRRRPRTKELP